MKRYGTSPKEPACIDRKLLLGALPGRRGRLSRASPREPEQLRYFGGLEMANIATVLDVSLGTVERDWRLARARLQHWLQQATPKET